MLISVIFIAVPVSLIHLFKVKRDENLSHLKLLNGLNNRLKTGNLISYVALLVMSAFIVWGITQPLDKWLTVYFFKFLPK